MILFNGFIAGIPKAQPRCRAFVRGKHAGVYDPGTADDWKRTIGIELAKSRPAVPSKLPIQLSLLFLLPRPKYMLSKKYLPSAIIHTAKPDWDNLGKAVCDMITQMGYWQDDSQVFECRVLKFYVGVSEQSGCSVTISELPSGLVEMFVGEC